MIHNNERNKWKRDKKIIVYSKLANDLISQEEWGKHKRSSELYRILGEASLLIENKNLMSRLEKFYKDSWISLNKSTGKRQEAENYGDENLIDDVINFHESEKLIFQKEAGEIMKLLRKDMLN